MRISLRGRMLALTFLLAVVAAACGGNANDAGGSGGPETAATTGASSSTGSTGSSDGAGRYGGYGDSTGASGENGDHSMGSGEGESENSPTVQANNFAFDPTDASVESGEDLYLKNGNANTPHTFTVDGTDIDVELAPLASDEVKLDLDPGTYRFHCRFHSQMTGTLTVT